MLNLLKKGEITLTPLLEVKNLSKAYGKQTVLKNINFFVNEGEVIVILGSSGSGKSTLLRTLNGLEDIDGGEIIFSGKTVERTPQVWSKLRPKIGMVFQSYDLFPNYTVIKNLLLGPTKVQKRATEEVISEAKKLLARIGLEDKERSFPRELSGGQKQRIAIVRALLMEPKLLLLDEITASLDPEMVREVLELIQELAIDRKTMVIVTHELNFARKVADKIIFIDQGEILCSKESEAFFTQQKNERIRGFLQSMDY